ncbi:MAG: RNA 2',3'-cyclic phosphodiesterase [Candidatus Thermoplasmatota archaeon]|nr:RNA 2',3'-cyclic phosphodiesterase [Candidatus Thermoplasmatota archaeon]MCL5793876.1 RNA 2',3'-cyclic phosphodiesterase [Candidatus Thermoplasmatota archaeon]
MRAFLAIEPDSLEPIAPLVSYLEGFPFLRVPRKENIHMTLIFFEDLPEKKASQICEGLSPLKFQAFSCDFDRLACFPTGKKCRVVVVECASPEPHEIYRQITGKIVKDTSHHGLRAHMTVARNRAPIPPESYSALMEHRFESRILFNRLTLFRSNLTSMGPVYERICSFQLM